jgi:amino acid permease
MYGSLTHNNNKEELLQPAHHDHDHDHHHHHHAPPQPHATVTSCVLNLANTIIGAGMLGLPGAFAGTGYVGGSLLTVAGALCSANGLVLLSKAAQQAGHMPSSFYTVAHAAVPHYTILIDLAVALKCFGVATGYLITVSDCMVKALDHILVQEQVPEEENEPDDALIRLVPPLWITVLLSRQFWVMGAVMAVLPVSFYRTLDDLKKASALALVFVLFLAFGIVAYAHGWADPCLDLDEQSCRGSVVAFTDLATTASKLPIFVFAFTCHQNIFPVVNELQQRTQNKINLIIVASIGLALVLFYTVALQGYQTFGSKTRGDVVLNYPETAHVTWLRFCIAIMLALHYPLQLDPARRCIKSLIQAWNNRHDAINDNNIITPVTTATTPGSDDPTVSLTSAAAATIHDLNHDYQKQTDNDDDSSDDDDNDTQFYVITIAFLACSFSLAMAVNDLGVILAMVGATGSTLVSYVLPGLIYIKLHPGPSQQDWSWSLLAKLQLGLGCLIMPLALYFVVRSKLVEG